MKARIKRPAPGTALGFLALLVALAGNANALSSHVVVRRGDIAKGAVTAKALASGAVQTNALAKGAVTAKTIASGAVGAPALQSDAVTSKALAPSAVYGGALGPVALHSAGIADPDVPPEISNWTVSGPVVAQCAPGERLLTGGVVFIDPGNGRVGITRSSPYENGWVGQITSDSNGTAKAEVQAVCLK